MICTNKHSSLFFKLVNYTVKSFEILTTICTKFQVCLGVNLKPGNTKGGSITVPLTSCLTGLESAVWQLTIFAFSCKTEYSKPVKQEVNGTVILPPLVFPAKAVWLWFSNLFLIRRYPKNNFHKIVKKIHKIFKKIP